MTKLLNFGNDEMIRATLQCLDLNTDDVYIDIGFGGGRALELAAKTVTAGRLYGIDFSPDVVTAAQQRLRCLIGSGRLDLLHADVEDLPFKDRFANKISTINTIYFWKNPAVALESLFRILTPSGTLAIGFTGAEKMGRYGNITAHGFTYYEAEHVKKMLSNANFTDIEIVILNGRITKGDFVVKGKKI